MRALLVPVGLAAMLVAPPAAGGPEARPRLRVHLGEVSLLGATPELARVGRDALAEALSQRGVAVESAGESAPRRGAAQGYAIDTRLHVREGLGATQLDVSLIVQTHPAREYRFEAATRITLSGGDAGSRAQRLEAVTRSAVARAAERCLEQL